MTVFLNGQFLDDAESSISIWDGGLLYGHGVYESFRSFSGTFKLLDKHLSRLRQSAAAVFIPLPYSDEELEGYLVGLIKKRQDEEPETEFRIRITLTAGAGNLRKMTEAVPTLLITAIKLSMQPDALILKSFAMERALPTVKSTAMLPAILGQHAAVDAGADEALLIDSTNGVHECSYSNIFLIKDGVLKYPSSGALQGVTKLLILELTKGLMPQSPAKLLLEDFYNAEEVFTTGAVRGIVLVKQIDDHVFPIPGSVAPRIQDLYRAWSKE